MSVSLPENPVTKGLLAGVPVLWLNPSLRKDGIKNSTLPICPSQVTDAKQNWQILAPLLHHFFPSWIKRKEEFIRNSTRP